MSMNGQCNLTAVAEFNGQWSRLTERNYSLWISKQVVFVIYRDALLMSHVTKDNLYTSCFHSRTILEVKVYQSRNMFSKRLFITAHVYDTSPLEGKVFISKKTFLQIVCFEVETLMF